MHAHALPMSSTHVIFSKTPTGTALGVLQVGGRCHGTVHSAAALVGAQCRSQAWTRSLPAGSELSLLRTRPRAMFDETLDTSA